MRGSTNAKTPAAKVVNTTGIHILFLTSSLSEDDKEAKTESQKTIR